MAVVRLFAAAREAAGTGRDELPGETVAAVLANALERYGPGFADVLSTCRIWVNGEAATDDDPVGADDELAVLPPVSGGADEADEGDEGDDRLDAVRWRRAELQAADDAISYVRRVAQARGDLARAEQCRRGGAAAATEDITAGLRTVLADRLLGEGGANRPPRPVEDFSDHPRAVELDERCARLGFGRLADLDDDELTTLIGGLDDFEREASRERQAIHAELDTLTEQLVERYRDRYAGATDEEGG